MTTAESNVNNEPVFDMDAQITENAFNDINTTISGNQSGVTIEKDTTIRTPYYTTYPWRTKEGDKVSIPVPIRWHPLVVVKNILNHNRLSGGYTGIVEIGMSGSGKTTITKLIVHFIHKLGENYIVKKFSGSDMLNIDKIIASCVPGFPHIIILDDASYVLQDAKKHDVSKLANALTTIRHQIKSRVIVIMNIHYSKAMLKFFRNQHFTFLVSVTPEELGNYQELFKSDMQTIHEFSRLYRSMYTKGYFRLPISTYDGTYLKYRTNDPFRICLVAEFTDLHYMLFPSERCDTCDPSESKLKIKDTRDLVQYVWNKWGHQGVLATQFKAFVDSGKIEYLPSKYRRIWDYWTNVQRQGALNWNDVVDTSKEFRVNNAFKKSKTNFLTASQKTDLASMIDDIKQKEDSPEEYLLRKKMEKLKQLQDEINMEKTELGLNDPDDVLEEPKLQTENIERIEYGVPQVIDETPKNLDNDNIIDPPKGTGLEDTTSSD